MTHWKHCEFSLLWVVWAHKPDCWSMKNVHRLKELCLKLLIVLWHYILAIVPYFLAGCVAFRLYTFNLYLFLLFLCIEQVFLANLHQFPSFFYQFTGKVEFSEKLTLCLISKLSYNILQVIDRKRSNIYVLIDYQRCSLETKTLYRFFCISKLLVFFCLI